MEALIIDSKTLPTPVSAFFDTERIMVSKRKSGDVVFSPMPEVYEKKIQVVNGALKKLHEMFSDRRFSSEDFIRQKVTEMEMEN